MRNNYSKNIGAVFIGLSVIFVFRPILAEYQRKATDELKPIEKMIFA